MIFTGTVYRRRSAANPSQPDLAGEKEIFECNPQRARRIMEETGWDSVYPGTLNLRSRSEVADNLRKLRPLFFERPEDVRHPTHPKIPSIRGGYFYYTATASAEGRTQEVLVRRAKYPHDPQVVELIACLKLREHLQVDHDSEVKVAICRIYSTTSQRNLPPT